MSRLATSLAECGADVEVLSLNPRKHRGVASGPVPIQAIDIDTSRVLVPMSREVPFIVARFLSREFREALDATLQRFQPDVVQIESPFLLPYASQVKNARVVLRSLNVEFRIWETLAKSERNPFRRFALQSIARSLRKYELREMNKLDAILPISKEDRDDFAGCNGPMHVVPCGVTLPVLSGAAAPSPPLVGFIGALDYRPNQEALRWILDDLWPRVLQREPNARLEIAGSGPPFRGVDYNVADAQSFIKKLAVVIAPLFAGSGMRIKVLEAMSLAKPIVATTLGARGIDVEPDRDILIADDADSFADAVVRLLREPETAARIGAAAREKVAQRYDNHVIARDLLAFYETLLPRS